MLIYNEFHDWPVHPDFVTLSNINKLDAVGKDGELHVVTPGVGSDGGVELALTLTGVEVGEGDVIEIYLASEEGEGLRLAIDPRLP